jgi:hypothetical protein
MSKTYEPMKCNAKSILKRNIEKNRQESYSRVWQNDKLHGTLEVGTLAATAEPVNTRKGWAW